MTNDRSLGRPLSILLVSRTHERVHYGFVLAAGAAAIGREVTVFATNGALAGLCRDFSPLEGAANDATLSERGVAGIAELREACGALGVRLLACDAGLRGEAMDAALLLPGVEVAGVTTFLAGAGDGAMITL